MTMLEHVCRKARGVRLPALPSRLLSVLAVCTPADAVCHHPAWPARPARASGGIRDVFVGARGLDLECATPADSARGLGPHRPSRPARAATHAPAVEACRILPFSAAFRRRSASTSAIRIARALRSAAEDRRQGRQGRPRIFRERNTPLLIRRHRLCRRDRRSREVGVPQRRHRAAGADRLARAVRPGHDRGHGLRHAGDRVQPGIRS